MANALRMRERFSGVLGRALEAPTELDTMTAQMVDIALNGIARREPGGGN
jgi:hypothetical protein